MRAKAVARANIALAKYWGKSDDALNLPAVPSVSLTLDPLVTDVSPLSAWETSFARTRKADGLKLMLDPRMDA